LPEQGFYYPCDAFHDRKPKTENRKPIIAMIYGIGVDLVKVARIERVLARYGDRFLDRVFTDREIAYCRGRSWAAAGFAMRFAAKEAFSKALGVGLRKGGIRWREVEVIPNPLGKPELYVSGRAAALCEAAGIENMHLSLTDEDRRALAVVILER
jgi:holo-[acyl-carrier protein] synthase